MIGKRKLRSDFEFIVNAVLTVCFGLHERMQKNAFLWIF